MAKRKSLAHIGIQPLTVQLVDTRYTNYVIRVPKSY